MKRLLLLFLLLFPAVLLQARERPADRIFDRFSGEKGYTTVHYGKKMLAMMKDGASAELNSLLEKIELIRIISTETGGQELTDAARSAAETGGYALISSVRKQDSETAFLLREETDGRSSFLMISHADGKYFVLDIYGFFNVRDISRLSTLAPQTDRR